MLVLSRRQGQRIVFPQLHISVQVLLRKGTSVRLGIEAPADVCVLRDEIAVPEVPGPAGLEVPGGHCDLHGPLKTLTLALAALEEQLRAGQTSDAGRTLREARTLLENLPQTPPRGNSRAQEDCP